MSGGGQARSSCVVPEVDVETESGEVNRVPAEGVMQCLVSEAGIDEDEGSAPIDPVAVAYAARASMRLPTPSIAGSPGLDAEQLVRVPVWLWIGADTWRPETARASVPGGSVSVTARPTSARWDLGDGSVVSCSGPGTRFDPVVHDPATESATCGHTFTRSSKGEPGGVFAVAVSVEWEVVWGSTTGEGGALEPLTTSAAADVVVTESFGVVVRG